MSQNEQDLLEEMNGRLKKIEFYLHNDEHTGREGLVKQVYKQGEEIRLLKQQEKIRKEKAAFWGGLFGGGVYGLFEIIKAFMK